MYRQAFVVLIVWNLVNGGMFYRIGFQINIIAKSCCLSVLSFRFICTGNCGANRPAPI